MYARRNSITIAVFWLLLTAIGYFWYTRETKSIKELEAKHEQLNQQLDGSLEVIEALTTLENKYQALKQGWEDYPKKIIAADEPSFSLYYLIWLINNYNISLDFDFILNNITEGGDIITFHFTLTGEGSYHDIYRLILFLTENPLLYQIESFIIRENKEDDDLLDFKMQIKGFSMTEKLKTEQEFAFETMKPVVETAVYHDSFKPLRKKPVKKTDSNAPKKESDKASSKPKDDGLLDIERTSLQAVANGQVYLKDKKGKLITLKKGDRVRLGSLRNINQKKSEVEFVLDKQGATKKVTLGLGYKK